MCDEKLFNVINQKNTYSKNSTAVVAMSDNANCKFSKNKDQGKATAINYLL